MPIRSRKRLLNITSEKKKDTMPSWTVDGAGGSVGGPVLAADTIGANIFVWIASARPASRTSGNVTDPVRGTKLDQSRRSSTTIFARGLRENLSISTTSGLAWQWRRIAFFFKGANIHFGDTDPETSGFFRLTAANGMVRLWNEYTASAVQFQLFRGEADVDWSSLMTAPIDTTRVTLVSDVLRTIKSGNDEGTIRNFKDWIAVNKNIVYDDEQQGESMFTSATSVSSKPGAGDLYVVDIFTHNTPGTADDQLTVTSDATFYWHEK